jgi:hypothetical protein
VEAHCLDREEDAMIVISAEGDTKNTEKFLEAMVHGDIYRNLDRLAQRGVEALRAATPRLTGTAADAWSYEIERSDSSATIYWLNTDVEGGFNVVVGLQYGHGTGNGGWIQGRDFINPAIRPIFDEIANEIWKEVQNA